MSREVVRLDHLVGLAEPIEAAPVGVEHSHAARLDGRLVLAAGLHLAVDGMALHLFAEQRLAGEIELQADPGCRYVADVVVGADVVGQVDGEAGVAPGGTEADFLGLDQDDLLVRKMQRQLARGGEAGEAGADHHPAGGAPAVVGRLRPPRRAEVVPAAGTVVGREVGYFRHRRDLTLVIGTR